MAKVKEDFKNRSVFVLGETKKISTCTEEELEVLSGNYPTWFEKAAVVPAVISPKKELTEDTKK
jgi:hypothetical protein